MGQITFLDEYGSFSVRKPENISGLYFPLASEAGLKSAVTPNLGGDAKVDQETFLLEPVSAEDLHNNRSTRNFWCADKAGNVFSLTGNSAEQEADRFTSRQDDSELEAGFMWHTMRRTSKRMSLSATVTSFIPVRHNVEIMWVTIRNTAEADTELTPYAAIPIYGRSADNVRDHRSVTAMLHRIFTTSDSVVVCPTMSFDEKGHRINENIYYVSGRTGEGGCPERFYPTVESYIGEGGSYTHPRSIYERLPGVPAGVSAAGREAMGAFRFPTVSLTPGEEMEYIILLGVGKNRIAVSHVQSLYNTPDKVRTALKETQDHWRKKVCIHFRSGDQEFDSLMRWVCFQPYLRRLFGCSYLPHHDYGRGGRGWRDLWQDCLSLLLMDPGDVGRMIEMNFGGVRIDGTNATIIGDGDGNFIADRNGIARVWMDHALWPLMTTQLYIDQTGDISVLNREVTYFKDSQTARGTAVDEEWSETYGSEQRTVIGDVYKGSILEHLLIQQLTAFYEVGDHNIYRLRGADWNDAIDMAAEHGESVAFTCAYAGNLRSLARLITLLEQRTSEKNTKLLKETMILLTASSDNFEDVQKKTGLLKTYTEVCRHHITGVRVSVPLRKIAENLTEKADWLMEHLRRQEWIEGSGQEGWFNSYYDNHGRAVEGYFGDSVRMMLTGQVFAIMSGTASDAQIEKIVRAADYYLYRKAGGYCLNTDFHELKFDMGRMFGFAYGEKENGAVFSHMAVMFAYALYGRGYAGEGWQALYALAKAALDFDASRIYPGIPEYFRTDGRGMYHYLTGAASWYLMTMTTEVYGVHGECGDLVLEPRLLAEQFDENRCASVSLPFAGKEFHIVYQNKECKEYGEYRITGVDCDGGLMGIVSDKRVIFSRSSLSVLREGRCRITVILR